MDRVDRDADDVIAATAERWRPIVEALDHDIVVSMPGRCRLVWEGTFWGGTDQAIIGYGDLVQPRPRGGSVEWFVVGLAAQRRHVSLYVNAVLDGAYLVQRWADRLGANGRRVKVGAANVTVTTLDHLDRAALRQMLVLADELCDPDR